MKKVEIDDIDFYDVMTQFNSSGDEMPDEVLEILIKDARSQYTKEDTASAVEVFRLLIKWRDEKAQNEK